MTFERPPKVSVEQWDQASALATGPGGWVAVGSNSDVMGYVGRIWQSSDSLSWKLVNSDLLAGLELVGLAATPDSYVAVGTKSANPNEPTASILFSSDGVTWTEQASIPGAWASRVTSGSQGFAVVIQVGETTDLLFSPDGRTWNRVAGADVSSGAWIADVARDGAGWIAVGSAGDRAVVLRSADAKSWQEDRLPASEPVEGIIDVNAYRVIAGRWAILVLGLDRGPSCAEDDDWCDKYQAAWSWTAETAWVRLPRSTWILGRGFGIDVHTAGDAGFVYMLGDEVRTSADGWQWDPVKQTSASNAFTSSVAVSGDRVVGVGTPAGGDDLVGWFGSALIRP
ncbi:MAG: hypothetical protein H0V07_05560 [Propionibacteriales bacterium]|nr:hypothetical protein [Propionibacteriales bacterium]